MRRAQAIRRLFSLLVVTPLLAPLALAPDPSTAQQAATAQDVDDPYVWLEDIEGERAMEWVLAENERTRQLLQALPYYRDLYEGALDVLTSTDRIAYPSIHGDLLYNFWTDGDHPRGIYRRTTWASYLSGSPEWEMVLDIDALVATEGTPWAFRGMSCLLPEERLCMVSLSPGGSDAVEVREFDVEAKRFVEGGFKVPVSKNSTAWVDENTLLVSHNLNPDYVTTSGYSRAAVRWMRGAPLEDAPVVVEAAETDMAVFVSTQETAEGPRTVVARFITIFDTDLRFLEGGELVPVDIPSDAQMALVGDRLVLRLVSDWEVGGRTFREGAVVSADLKDYLAGGRDLELVLQPDERSTVSGIAATRDYLLVIQFTDVQGKLIRYWRAEGGWAGETIDTPPLGSAYPISLSVHHNRFFFTFDSFTQPTTLFLVEEDGSVRQVRRLPEQFSSDGLLVEQHHATSHDGTRVPYFVVRPEDAPMDGSSPTLLYAYGGFQISSTPAYLGVQGKAWVEDGGVYVLANIRGGGEFGPSWWKAALKENRQRAYDDFLAVAEDLVARGITSPEHLGIQGASNGGLLVGAAMTQRPELFSAVVVQVPLLDMKRYHKLLAGASWMAEYGNPDLPEEWAYIGRYSPYQNVRADVDYPRPFIFTTTRDDRVHPGHARKMAAKMMEQGHEVLYFENVEGGHGAGVTPEQRAESLALSFAYLRLQLGMPRRPVSQ
jgi:prolyl oligopeptidase